MEIFTLLKLLSLSITIALIYLVYKDFIAQKELKKDLEAKKLLDIQTLNKAKELESELLKVSRLYELQQAEIAGNQDHLARIREQLRVMDRRQRILRDNMIRRYEIVLPKNFHDISKKLAKQSRDLQ